MDPRLRNDGDNTSFCSGETCHNNEDQVKQVTGVKEEIKKTRVFDDAYYKKRYDVEAYMEGGEYEEFESALTHVQDDLKELRKTLQEAIGYTRAYGNTDLKFKEIVMKYDIIATLEAAAQHFNVPLTLSLLHSITTFPKG